MKNLYFLVAAFSFLSTAAQIPTAGLVGAWPFTGNANDVSGNNNNATVYGASLTTDRCGNPNSAYSFNGTTNYIQTLLAGPSGTVSRSVSFWAKTTNLNLMTCFAYGNNSGGLAYAVQYNYNCPGVGIDVNNEAYTRGNTCVNDGYWHHIVAIFNASLSTQFNNVDIYVDGLLVPGMSCVISGSTQTINTGTVFPISFGRIHDANSRYFNGSLDDFYLYNRAISSAEVQQLYTACNMPIVGPTLRCVKSTGNYSISPISGTGNYNWALPAGWTGTSSTNSIFVSNFAGSGIVQVTGQSACGGTISSTLQVVVSGCTGITESEGESTAVQILCDSYHHQLKIESDGTATLRLFDTKGSLLLENDNLNSNQVVDLSELQAGIYFVKVTTANSSSSLKKIVLQ